MNTVTINYDILRSQIIGKYPFRGLYDELSYSPPGAYFASAFVQSSRGGKWDGKIRLLTVNHTFPSGLLNRVVEYMKKNDIQVKLNTKFSYPISTKETTDKLNESELRGYQQAALNILLAHKRGILKIPTAGGKTIVAAALIRKIGLPAVFASNQTSILMNAEKVFKRELNPKAIGFIGDQRREYAPISICSVATLSRQLQFYKQYLSTKKVLIVDEVHHASAQTWYNVCNSIPAPYRYGLSATPDTGPLRLKLEATIGPVIFAITPKELMDKGYLSVPTVYMVKNDQQELPERHSFEQAYDEGIVNSPERNSLIAKIVKFLLHKNITPICLLGIRLDQIDNIWSALLAEGVDTSIMTSLRGYDASMRREIVMNQMDSGKIKVLLATKIFDEGVDIPSIRALIIAGAHSKEYKVVQRIGRGLRIAQDKDEVLVIDFMDESHEYLKKHSNSRRKTYAKYEYDPTVVTFGELTQKLN
jgi:superfamily II DNA or RNA helicase